jgi:nitrogen fixation/metabolism regulation signal transduction histidine kinase
MEDNKCLIHAESIAMLQGKTLNVEMDIQSIKTDIKDINHRLDKLSRVEYKNGGGMPSSADLSTFLNMIYEKINVGIIKEVENNIEDIVKIADKYRESKQDKKTIQWNNRMQFLMFIIAFLSVIVNIILFIHIGK